MDGEIGLYSVGALLVGANLGSYVPTKTIYHPSPVLAAAVARNRSFEQRYVITATAEQLLRIDASLLMGGGGGAVAGALPATNSPGPRMVVCMGPRTLLLILDEYNERLDIQVFATHSLSLESLASFSAASTSSFTAVSIDFQRLAVLIGGRYRLFDVAGTVSELLASTPGTGLRYLASSSGYVILASESDIYITDERGNVIQILSSFSLGLGHITCLATSPQLIIVGDATGAITAAALNPPFGVLTRIGSPDEGSILNLHVSMHRLTVSYSHGLLATYVIDERGIRPDATSAVISATKEVVCAVNGLVLNAGGDVYEIAADGKSISKAVLPEALAVGKMVDGSVVGISEHSALVFRDRILRTAPLPLERRPRVETTKEPSPIVKIASNEALALTKYGSLVTFRVAGRKIIVSPVPAPPAVALVPAAPATTYDAICILENRTTFIQLRRTGTPGVFVPGIVHTAPTPIHALAPHPCNDLVLLVSAGAGCVVHLHSLSVGDRGRLELSGGATGLAAVDPWGVLGAVVVESEGWNVIVIFCIENATILCTIGQIPQISAISWVETSLVVVLKTGCVVTWSPNSALRRYVTTTKLTWQNIIWCQK